jgi:lipoprotein-anchoring transpeptidase ErfK/SrfK
MRTGGLAGRWGAAVAALTLLALVAGSSDSTAPGGSRDRAVAAGPAETTASPTPPPAPRARVFIRPANRTEGVSPLSPIRVSAEGGTLQSVTVRNPAGELVKGRMSADRRRWISAEPLGYSKTYSAAAVAVNAEGRRSGSRTRFSTVEPRTLTLPYLSPVGVDTMGVGTVIGVHFDEPVADRAAAERALVVETSPKVGGAWHWFGDQTVHWRPKSYWPPGTRVTVRANVYGVHVGDGVYGQEDVSTSFRIGRSKVAVVDDRTHLMKVYLDGKLARTVPVSMGRDSGVTVNGRFIDFETQSGVHVVQERHRRKVMSSESFGLPEDDPDGYRTDVEYAVRISPSGEFVHSAPWSVDAQGSRNVSHGCVNVAPSHAIWFYNTFRWGDVVDIRHTNRPAPQQPRYDEWGMSWGKWTAGSALS